MTKKIILSGLLLSILIVFDRFISIKTQFLQISLSFLPIIISAIVLGPKYSTTIAALGDLIGALLWPFGAYFIGFTLVDALVGLVYGLLLYNKNEGKFFEGKKLLIRLIISSAIVLWIIELPGMSLMLSLLYGKAFLAILSGRILTKLIMFPIQISIVFFLSKSLNELSQKYLYTDLED